jgi:FkbM family methyltransferase
MTNWRKDVRVALDRRGTRWLLGLIGSLGATALLRKPCWIRWRDGAWIHHLQGAAIPQPELIDAHSLGDFTAEVEDIFLYEYKPGPGDVVIDVGAGFGAEALVFSRLVGSTGSVISLEPHPATYSWFIRLCRLNSLENVTPLQIAVSAEEGDLIITDQEAYERNTVLADGSDGITVRARTLDDLARDLNISQVNLLTMNIEGAEQLAIRGMADLVDRTHHVCIGCHDFLADKGGSEIMRTKHLVREFLLEHGFELATREDASEPWTRDYIYGVNRRLATPPAEVLASSTSGDR